MRIAVIGAGTIGLSWTKLFAEHGHDVRVSDPRPDLAEVLREFDPARVRAAADVAEAVRDADVVQENGPENLAFKKDLFAALVEQAPSHALLLSSSSAIPSSEFAPEDGSRVLIGHPFNPPHVVPLVEVVPGERTSEDSIRRAVEFYRSLGRVPVVERKEVPGFVGNRLQAALQREAVSLVQQGVVTPDELDTVMVNSLGLRWAAVGPFLGSHLGGGPGGYRHLTEHIGSSMHAMRVGEPDTSPEATEKVVQAVERAYGDKSYAELARERDRKQIAILSVTGEQK
ncbi:ketoreductase RED1 [Amycolatopsis bartoniae]|uniref:Hydroxylacyl-CoA dehydrogenase n=1 Tax=Amycolatopsis bartoniae TaxID=941986 RepID=A0A8H9IS50_9PSEU|nr:3-hydroxyacyl-CoA dehydrogenase NAD-binding domain-containing protein [Amycolatopsis bartoniae]MBB2934867.1 ketoreductase RED1 [Amycolatopsis bartoniae]TVT00753.1 hydroxylacyl-CoA dehydrogenase [Amycolatopsis bartoniae]GHF44212.1 hydroxylacyl-CoA dehydrogenase [Amycolatopsis bartoniae]